MSTSVDIFSRLCESDKETAVNFKTKNASGVGEKRSHSSSSNIIIIPEEENEETVIDTNLLNDGAEETPKPVEPVVAAVTKGHKRTRSITNRYKSNNQVPVAAAPAPLPVINEIIVGNENENLVIVPLEKASTVSAESDLSIPNTTDVTTEVSVAVTEIINTVDNEMMNVATDKTNDGMERIETIPPAVEPTTSIAGVSEEDIKILEKQGFRHDWNIHYAALLDHIAKFGHANVRRSANYECGLIGLGKDDGDYHYVGKLGIWLSSQRQSKKKCPKSMKLMAEREALLQALVDDGKLQWDTRDDNISWSKNFAALVKYGEEHGSCNVPNKVSYECTLIGMADDGNDYYYKGKLGLWLDNQRRAKKGNGKGKLMLERAALLQGLVDEGKLLWEPGDKIPWDISYAALLEYCKQHGTCNIPVRDTYECTLVGMGENGTDHHYTGNLGTWFKNQRRAKNGTIKNKLTPEKELKLQLLVDEGKMRW